MPDLGAKSAKQGLLLSAVAEGFCLAGPAETSAPCDTEARLSTLVDVEWFDNCSRGLDADW